jgi:hypothetical protein
METEIDKEKRKEDLVSIRFANVSGLLTESNPSLIPFKCKFPLVPELEYRVFLEQLQRYEYIDELPNYLKEILDKAEKIKDWDFSFKNFLIEKDISKREFKEKNPKTKLDILYEWLFSEQLDISVLEL